MKNIPQALCFLCLLLIQSSNANSDWDWLANVLSGLSSKNNLRGDADVGMPQDDSTQSSSIESTTSIQSTNQPIYINCGSSRAAIDSTGQDWQPDTFYKNGSGQSTQTAGFEEDGAIFQTMRTTWQFFGLFPSPLKYDIAVPADDEQYTVTLYFTERFNFWDWLFSGGRDTTRVDVLLQGELVWDQLELVADNDTDTAPRSLRRETTVTSSSSGRLKIEIQSSNGDPTLSAIAIEPLDPDVVVGTPNPVPVPTSSSVTEAPTSAPTRHSPSPVTPEPTLMPVISSIVPSTESPMAPEPTDAPMLPPTTPQPTDAIVTLTLPPSSSESCGMPKFVGSWEGSTNYPMPVAEAQGAMIGNDFVIISGFHEPDGGYDAATAKIYALDTTNSNASWRRMDDLPVSQGITHAGFVVIGNKFYMCGGYLGGHPGPHIKTCLIYDHSKAPGSGQWSYLPDLPLGRAGGGMIYDTNSNSLVYAGGAERPNPNSSPDAVDYRNTWKLDLGNMGAGWIGKKDIPFDSNHMSFVTTMDETLTERHFFVGGQVGENEYTGNIKVNYEYDVGSDTWIRLRDMPYTLGHAASSTRAISCGFLIAGGSTNEFGKTKDVYYYSIPDNLWTKIGELPFAINTPVCDISPDGHFYCESGWAGGIFSYRRKITVE